MTRRRRTEILARAEAGFVRSLAASVEAEHRIRVIQAPCPVLVMVQMRESGRNSRFYVGEVMVTEARVELAGSLGLGHSRCEDEAEAAQRALDAAIVDAACLAGLPQAAWWDLALMEKESAIGAEDAREVARLHKSLVSFGTMES